MAAEITLLIIGYLIYLAARKLWKRRARKRAAAVERRDRERMTDPLSWDELVALHRSEKERAQLRHELDQHHN